MFQTIKEKPTFLFAKGRRIIKEGQLANKAYLVKKGLFRRYYYTDAGEVTQQFYAENDIILSAKSFYLDKPSKYVVEALENAKVYVLELNEFVLEEEIEPLKHIFCKYILQNESLELIHATKEPAIKYELFLKAYPSLGNRVPQKHIASLLQIHPSTLSKVRGKMAKKQYL
jgi:CRP-like cAMP-binding protein